MKNNHTKNWVFVRCEENFILQKNWFVKKNNLKIIFYRLCAQRKFHWLSFFCKDTLRLYVKVFWTLFFETAFYFSCVFYRCKFCHPRKRPFLPLFLIFFSQLFLPWLNLFLQISSWSLTRQLILVELLLDVTVITPVPHKTWSFTISETSLHNNDRN